jgi:hypothetical protein
VAGSIAVYSPGVDCRWHSSCAIVIGEEYDVNGGAGTSLSETLG